MPPPRTWPRGGDEYFPPGSLCPKESEDRATLRQFVAPHLARCPGLRRRNGLEHLVGRAWKSRAKVSGSLNRRARNPAAGQ